MAHIVLWYQRFRNVVLRTALSLILRPKRFIIGLERLGELDGAWIVPLSRLGPKSICYCAGVGEDISFDLALIERRGCDVYAFDPTPRAIEHVRRIVGGKHPKYHFVSIGIWHRDERVRFYAPRNPTDVSHSALNLQRTEKFFEANCKSLPSIMHDLGHDSLDLLKLDIEGAEHLVIESILAEGIAVGTLCVEFDQPVPITRLVATLRQLRSAGYRIVSIDRWNYTFVKEAPPLRPEEQSLIGEA